MDLWALGKLMVVLGLGIGAFGAVLLLLGKFPNVPIGRLPGDIAVSRGNFRFYFPLATSLLLSLVLTLLFRLFGKH